MNEKIKICKRCDRERTLAEFPPKKHMCLECADKSKEARKKHDSEYHKVYYIENKEVVSEKRKKYKKKNKEKIAISNKIYRDNHKEHIRQYSKEKNTAMSDERRAIINERKRSRYQAQKTAGLLPELSPERKEYQKTYHKENKDRIKEVKDQYIRANRELVTKRKREWKNMKLATDVEFRLQNNLRAVFRSAVKSEYKNSSILILLGCSLEEFKKHIESQFLEGMSWNNWGLGDDKWHMDHITPVSAFNMADYEQQKKCWHYTNLRPLWQKDNLEKSDKLPDGTRARNLKGVQNVG